MSLPEYVGNIIVSSESSGRAKRTLLCWYLRFRTIRVQNNLCMKCIVTMEV